jgi:hypothetical protein
MEFVHIDGLDASSSELEHTFSDDVKQPGAAEPEAMPEAMPDPDPAPLAAGARALTGSNLAVLRAQLHSATQHVGLNACIICVCGHSDGGGQLVHDHSPEV